MVRDTDCPSRVQPSERSTAATKDGYRFSRRVGLRDKDRPLRRLPLATSLALGQVQATSVAWIAGCCSCAWKRE
jgi:hypothetical protein